MQFENIKQTETARSGLTTTHARLCRALALSPGLFQPLFDVSKKDRPKLYVEIIEKNGSIVLEGANALDAYDGKVLTTLVAISGPNGLYLAPRPKTEIGQIARNLLDPKDVCKADTLFVMTTPTALLREMGIGRGQNALKALTNSLRRLSGVTLYATMGKRDEALHLMSFHKNEEPGRDRMCVALNPIIAGAITGGQHVRIDMNEVRAIKSDTASILHMRLCAAIDWPTGRKTKTRDGLSNTKSFMLSTLIPYVWPNESANQSTTRSRRLNLRKALDELAGLPRWDVVEYAKNKFRISRLFHPKGEAANPTK